MSIKKLHHAGFVLRTLILDRSPNLISDHKVGPRTFRRCMVGSEMVDWILQQSPASIIKCRLHAVGMWQALLEENALSHGNLLYVCMGVFVSVCVRVFMYVCI